MSWDDFVPALYPAKGSSQTTGFTLLVANFGDGYTQRADAGINSTKDTWTLNWDVLTLDQAGYIYDFLVAHRAVAFTYYALNNDLTLYTCKSVSKTFDVTFYKVDATIEQQFDLAG